MQDLGCCVVPRACHWGTTKALEIPLCITGGFGSARAMG